MTAKPTSRFRLIALAASAGVVISLLLSGTALAAPSASSSREHSSRPEPSVGSLMNAQLRFNPSGKVIGADRVSYDNGNVVITVVPAGDAAPDFTCATGSVCLFEGTDLTGTHAEISRPLEEYIAISSYLSGPVKSLHNVRTDRIFLNQRTDGGGYVCYPAGAIARDIGTPYRNFGYLYLAESNETCPAPNP